MRKAFVLIVGLVLWTPCCSSLFGTTTNAFADAISAKTTGSITGTVVDPQGALIPHAVVTVTLAGGPPTSVTADELGRFTLDGLAPGKYTLVASAEGFRSLQRIAVTVTANAKLRLPLTLEIEVQQQQVEVSASDVDSSPDKNGDAIVLKGKDLDALSNDPNELQMQLQAMAGADPESGPQMYVDGFSGGKMPPKSAIREIRINQNPYSAQYDAIGYGRIEIFTKPGADKLQGEYWMEGNDSAFNTKNPFVTTQPSYYSYFFGGDLNGPITKQMSFFTEGYGQSGINDAIVNAIVLNASFQQTSLTQAVSTPMRTLNLSQRLDLQLGKIQTLSLRYQLQQTRQTNAGIGQFNLPSQGYNMENTEQVLQFSDTQAYGAKVVNETRFQYIRDRNNQNALSLTPTLIVTGAFTGGGNSLGIGNDKQDHYEFQNYLHISAGTHDINLGGRVRAIRDSNLSTSNFNGQFTFASLTAYQITAQGIQNGLTPAQIRAAGGGASQFSQTQGKPSITVSVIDTGLYAEDNWKLNPSVTLTYGMRFETQTQIHDHADFAPRAALAWAIPGAKNKPPRAVIRAGAGFFYDRFQSANVLEAERQNGVTETQVFINSPDFFPDTCATNPSECSAAGSASSSPTIYSINPNLRAPYALNTGIGLDKPLGKVGQISVNYTFAQREHQFLTRNINAPLPGTYNVNDPSSGVRPLGTNQNIYQYESEGASHRNRVVVNGNLHFKQSGFFGNYVYSRVRTNTQGISTFPSNSYDLHEDYGQGINNLHHRLFIGGYSRLPGGFSFNPFFIYQSSTPFNITVGQDLNGDSIFNDRPAFATDLSRSSVYRTKFGNFDASPIAGQTIIPINYGKGPGLAVLNLRVNRNFGFGPRLPEAPTAPAPDAASTSKDAKAPAKAEPAKAADKPTAKPVKKGIERRYNLSLGVGANNVFNHVNLGPPVGVLGSPLFGESTSTSSLFGSGSANRTVNFEMYFHF